jgi:hypothetical protein
MNRRVWLLGFALCVATDQAGRAQFPPPVPQYNPLPSGVDLGQVSRRMAEALRDLVEDLTAAGHPAANDCRELQAAAGEWFESTRSTNDPYQLRRTYAGIDLGWHRLRDQLSAPGAANPAILDEIRRVDQADAAIHQALNLNTVPPNLEGRGGAPAGIDEIRRLAYTLAQRGEALSAMARQVYPFNTPSGFLANDSIEIANLADAFSDALNGPNGPPPIEQAQQMFLNLLQKSIGFGVNLGRFPIPPPVRATWDNYTSVLNLARDNLRLKNVDPNLLGGPVGNGYNPNPAGQVTQWADRLDRQVDELIANFAPTVGVVPEGRDMLNEMVRLRDDVRNFRRNAARGADPGHLAFDFRAVDADWQRLARRFNRVARGRTGPNIRRVQEIGETCAQIHQVLGMPGFAPIIQPY